MLRHRIPWLAIGVVVLILVLLGWAWPFVGHDGTSETGGVAVTLGVIVALALGIGLIAIILYGRRSRRDEAVRRASRHNELP